MPTCAAMGDKVAATYPDRPSTDRTLPGHGDCSRRCNALRSWGDQAPGERSAAARGVLATSTASTPNQCRRRVGPVKCAGMNQTSGARMSVFLATAVAEYLFDGPAEELGDSEREWQAGVVFPGFDRVNGLPGDVEPIRQFHLCPAARFTQLRHAILHLIVRAARGRYSRQPRSPSCCLEPRTCGASESRGSQELHSRMSKAR